MTAEMARPRGRKPRGGAQLRRAHETGPTEAPPEEKGFLTNSGQAENGEMLPT